MHPALFYLILIISVHHGEIESHLSILEGLYNMVYRLHANVSKYEGANCVAMINLREVAQELHNQLVLVDYGQRIFTRQHVSASVAQLRLQFLERMVGVSYVVHFRINTQIAAALAALPFIAAVDPQVNQLEA